MDVVHYDVAELDELLPAPTPEGSNPKDRRERGLLLFHEGHFEQAARVLRLALQEEESPDCWNDWATAELAAAYRQAEDAFRRALELDARNVEAAANLGALLAGLGRTQESLPFLEHALGLAAECKARRLRHLLQTCRDAVLQTRSQLLPPSSLLGWGYLRAWGHTGAAEGGSQDLSPVASNGPAAGIGKAGPASVSETRGRGLRLLQDEKFEDAARVLAEAIEEDQSSGGWSDWGTAALATGQMKAEEGFRRALALDNGNVDAAVNLVVLLAGVGRAQEGAGLLQRAARLSAGGQLPMVQHLLALCEAQDPGPRVVFWKRGEARQNFGDFLSTILLSDVFAGAKENFRAIHLIGSVISNYRIAELLQALPGEDAIAFWGCGMRDKEKLHPAIYSRCHFFGVRGPLTRACLALPLETPIGDPGLLVPVLHPPRPVPALIGKTICVPHFEDQASDQVLLKSSDADVVIRPAIAPSREALFAMIDSIGSADFVLAGALHAAVVACALGTPFAFFDSGHVDIPFKWLDFAASIQVPAVFVRCLDEGRRAYEQFLRPCMRKPKLAPLLKCAPLRLRRGVLDRVLAYDQQDTASQCFRHLRNRQ